MARKYERGGRLWTEEEVDFLMDHYGYKTLEYISKNLKRSPESCRLKHYQITGTHDQLGSFAVLSLVQVAEALDVDSRTVNVWTKTLGFPSIRLLREKGSTAKSRIHVPIDKVWSWVAKHKERVNFANVKVGIITPEPDWVLEEIKEARKKPIVKQGKLWSKEEDDFLFREYFIEERNIEDIALDLQRPKNGANRRLTVLRKNAEQQGYVFKRGWQGRLMLISSANAEALMKVSNG